MQCNTHQLYRHQYGSHYVHNSRNTAQISAYLPDDVDATNQKYTPSKQHIHVPTNSESTYLSILYQVVNMPIGEEKDHEDRNHNSGFLRIFQTQLKQQQ